MKPFEHIDVASTIERTIDNEPMAKEWYGLLREEIEQSRALITDAWQKKDLQTIKALAHKLRGACCYCSAPHLKALVTSCENQIQDNEDALKEEHVQALLAEMVAVTDDIDSYLSDKVENND